MGSVKRIYVEKKEPFAVRAKELHEEIGSFLGINAEGIRVFIRYDVENVSEEVFGKACMSIFSEPPVDELYYESIEVPEKARVFSVEYLPGQFDQRADSAVQCIRFLNEDEEPVIRTAVTYMILGDITDEEFARIRAYCINPVDSRETGSVKPDTLIMEYEEPADVAVLDGFVQMGDGELEQLYQSLSLAMTFRDFLHIRNYFREDEKRNPTMTEIRVLDTYWSDHCRHTTFSTELTDVEFGEGYYRSPIETTYRSYLDTREEIYGDRKDKFICLMDLALMAMKKLKKEGRLDDMEESDEINACSVVVPVEMDYGSHRETEEWLVFFKNETHNHPTEIEPFGGAATCLGGAIRDPLSGRGYVYQAMRVTGAADPSVPVSDTLRGKLPQKKLVRGAAGGYSSYGNQIGLATGYVKEIYHPSYVAKRMEIGAVMGAAPRKNVIRGTSDPGDIIILLGGRTGRDGCGGATGSSKVHTEQSIETCGAEVQKGNAPTERKIQRLFRRKEASRLIKKCNDFGAGGVSVAIGELAEGLTVDLDKVPKKYAGLDGTELAISESQERMAVVVDPKDVEAFLGYAAQENLEAVEVAVVTEEPRLVLNWRGRKIVDLKRAFLDTNGAHQETRVKVDIPDEKDNYFDKWAVPAAGRKLKEGDVRGAWLELLHDLNVCSQKGLVEMFDASIGAGSVPSGKYTVVFSNKTMATLLMTYASVFSAEAAQKGMSLLNGKEGEKIAADFITIVDDPSYHNSVMKRSFDGEGVATYAKNVVEDGVLTTLLHNLKTAANAGVKSTGNAGRPSYASVIGVSPFTFYIRPDGEAGEKTAGKVPEDLLRKADNGIYVTELTGLHAGASAVTGDFSLSARGFLIAEGAKAAPVKNFTVSGNFFDLLKSVEVLGKDLDFVRGTFGSPSMLIRNLAIAGEE